MTSILLGGLGAPTQLPTPSLPPFSLPTALPQLELRLVAPASLRWPWSLVGFLIPELGETKVTKGSAPSTPEPHFPLPLP